MERSKESARAVLHALIPVIAAATEDADAKKYLSEELVDRVLDEAWFAQFSHSRAEFKATIREAVADTIRTAER